MSVNLSIYAIGRVEIFVYYTTNTHMMHPLSTAASSELLYLDLMLTMNLTFSNQIIQMNSKIKLSIVEANYMNYCSQLENILGLYFKEFWL